jgi:hypothetical protein
MTIYIYFQEYLQLERPQDADYSFFLFQFMFHPVFLLLLVSINVNVWANSKINYIFIFEINPRFCSLLKLRTNITNWQFTELALIVYFVWIFHLLLYIFISIMNQLHSIFVYDFSWLIPVFMVLLYTFWLFFPGDILYKPARYWLIVSIIRYFHYNSEFMFHPFYRLLLEISGLVTN